MNDQLVARLVALLLSELHHRRFFETTQDRIPILDANGEKTGAVASINSANGQL
jgi:hypothetical protein